MSKLKAFIIDARDSYFVLIAVVALNTPLICAIVFSNLVGEGLAGTTFFYSLTVAVGYYCLPLLVAVSVLFLLTAPFRRITVLTGVTVVTVFVTYLLLDSLAYRVVKFHIDPFWFEFALRDPSGLGLPSSSWFAVGAIVLGVIAIETLIALLARRVHRRGPLTAFPVIAVAAFAFSQIIHLVAYEWNDQRITSLTPHFPLYMPITSHKNASTYRDMLPWVDAQAAVTSGGEEYQSLRYPLAQMRYEAGDEAPNIVLILLESWRYDSLNEIVSPNIHRLGLKSSVFLDHISSGNQTTCGVFGLFYGLHATYWTAVKANSSEIHNPVLIDALQSRDYSFGIFAKSRFKRHKITDTTFRGIEVRESFSGRTKVDQDADLTGQLIDFIEEEVTSERRFFAFAFYKSTHAPYEYPPEHAVFSGSGKVNMGFTNGSTDPAPRLREYHNAVHYVDSLVGRVVGALERLGQMDDTVVIITTDHGESFNDNHLNYWGHGSNFTQYQTRVPLVFYAPNREPRRVSHRTAHVDVAPTLLREFLGCSNDVEDYSNGRSLFESAPASRPLAVGSYVNHAFVFDEEVFEIHPVRTRKYKLHDPNIEAAWPEPSQLKALTEEVRRFIEQ